MKLIQQNLQSIDPVRRRAICLLLMLLVLSVATSSAANENREDAYGPYFISGYDVVSYFRETGPIKGSVHFATTYKNRTLLFASENNLMDFLANPDLYMPEYNGYCAYGMVYGMKSKVDPLQYDIVNGRLYLQLDKGTKRRWNRRVKRNIRKSDNAWKQLISEDDSF